MGKIKLKDISTRSPKEADKVETKEQTEKLLGEFRELQNLLYASSGNALLVVFQGMDASGKDGAIRKVFSTVNPQGITVQSFKVPTEEEMKHDFLWRIHMHAPAKGMIQVFNRSYYEDVLVTRVHKWCDDETAHKRMKAINDFEELLTGHNNTNIIKFYLHVSQEEQLQRLNERVTDPTKQWKYNKNDFEEAKLYPVYQEMYEDCFEHCDNIPWHIVPADQNWYKEYVMVKTIVSTLKSLKMAFPEISKE
jgi:PPK2 family polyphosphate:nucleotide phosphotransferase